MVQIINRKRYDTNTATYICQCAKGKLYRKYHSQEFFLCFNNKTITPVSWNEAKEIIRANGTAVYYQRMFDPVPDDRRTNVDIPQGSYNKLRELAGMSGISIKRVLIQMIEKEHRNRNRHIKKS